MKVTRLHKAKEYRIFRDFAWPAAGLPDFARFNVIYGWNGSGKTSLSNVFRHIQRKEALTERQVEVVVDQTRVSGSDFASGAIPAVRTFNRDTVDRNIFEVPNQQLPPVFYLGEDSVEKQRLIEGLKKQHESLIQSVSSWDRKNAEASSALEAFCAEEAKGIKNLLTVAGGGPFNNYNAANFKPRTEPAIWRSRLVKTSIIGVSSLKRFDQSSLENSITRSASRWRCLIASAAFRCRTPS